MREFRKVLLMVAIAAVMLTVARPASGADLDEAALYWAYRDSFEAVQMEGDIAKNGFRAVESQVFDVEHGALGMLKLIPAIHTQHGRLALFLVGRDSSVAVKTDDFMAKSRVLPTSPIILPL